MAVLVRNPRARYGWVQLSNIGGPMSGTVKTTDIITPPLGKDLLNAVRIRLAGATAVTKGNIVRVITLAFGPRGEARTGTVDRADHADSKGKLFIASHDASVGDGLTCVSWLPFQMVTTGATVHDPVYLATTGLPTLVDPGTGLVIGTVVFVGTIAAGGCVILQAPNTPRGN